MKLVYVLILHRLTRDWNTRIPCLIVNVPGPAFTGHWRFSVLHRSTVSLKYGITPYLTNTLMFPPVTSSSGGEKMSGKRRNGLCETGRGGEKGAQTCQSRWPFKCAAIMMLLQEHHESHIMLSPSDMGTATLHHHYMWLVCHLPFYFYSSCCYPCYPFLTRSICHTPQTWSCDKVVSL